MNYPTHHHADTDPYSLLRTALVVFEKLPKELNSDELAAVIDQARKEHDIETRVLASPQAASVIVTDEELNHAVQQIRQRFNDEEHFIKTLTQNNLCLDSLQKALTCQCKVENVLQIIGTRSATVTEVEIGIFYHMHLDKFRNPERRSASHILITINNDYADNTQETALKRINDIAAKLAKKAGKFSDLAM